jgi:hypothetical protein
MEFFENCINCIKVDLNDESEVDSKAVRGPEESENILKDLRRYHYDLALFSYYSDAPASIGLLLQTILLLFLQFFFDVTSPP